MELLGVPVTEVLDPDGTTVLHIQASDLYPKVIDRIKAVVASGEVPYELVATEERGGIDRMKFLLKWAKALPEEAWQAALTSHADFQPVTTYVDPHRREAALEQFKSLGVHKAGMAKIEQAWQRGDALNLTLGWFLHALRLKIGGSNNVIEDPDRYYKI